MSNYHSFNVLQNVFLFAGVMLPPNSENKYNIQTNQNF